MRYILCNLYFTNDSYLDQIITNDILKSIPYNAKKIEKRTKLYSFLYILFPIDDLTEIETLKNEYPETSNFVNLHIQNISTMNNNLSDSDFRIYSSIFKLFSKIVNYKYSFDIINIIDDTSFDIYYTDGSSSLKQSSAAWAYAKIKEIFYGPESLYENLTETYRSYESNSGKLNIGTNNTGELTGIKKSIENGGNKDIQVILSDSEYSVKSFREWIHNWKKNGYKGSNRKLILNSDLIKEIETLIESNNKIYLFGWVKGHEKSEDGTDAIPFNALCDKLAKQELGIGNESK